MESHGWQMMAVYHCGTHYLDILGHHTGLQGSNAGVITTHSDPFCVVT